MANYIYIFLVKLEFCSPKLIFLLLFVVTKYFSKKQLFYSKWFFFFPELLTIVRKRSWEAAEAQKQVPDKRTAGSSPFHFSPWPPRPSVGRPYNVKGEAWLLGFSPPFCERRPGMQAKPRSVHHGGDGNTTPATQSHVCLHAGMHMNSPGLPGS